MNTKWQQRFMEMAFLCASWSKDPSSKVGAVITQGNRIVSQGFNGYPHGVTDNPDNPRELKYQLTIHAEANALLHSKRDLTGCSIFATHYPCPNCTAMIIQSGITHIYVPEQNDDFLSRWSDQIAVSNTMIDEVGIVVTEVAGFAESNQKTSCSCKANKK